MAAVNVQAARPARTAPPVPRRQPAELPEGFWYSVKCRALGLPLVTEQLKNQRLSRPLALGVLSCDGLSSAAYGTEEILRAAPVLRPGRLLAGAADDPAHPVRRRAGRAVLPRGGVGVHQGRRLVRSGQGELRPAGRPGGRGRAADRLRGHGRGADGGGSAAIVSAFPALSGIPVIGPKILLVISVVAILAMCLGNLRGIREAGRIFALPTYLFAGSLVVMIVTGIVREMTGGLPHVADRDHLPGAGVHVDPPQPAVP